MKQINGDDVKGGQVNEVKSMCWCQWSELKWSQVEWGQVKSSERIEDRWVSSAPIEVRLHLMFCLTQRTFQYSNVCAKGLEGLEGLEDPPEVITPGNRPSAILTRKFELHSSKREGGRTAEGAVSSFSCHFFFCHSHALSLTFCSAYISDTWW